MRIASDNRFNSTLYEIYTYWDLVSLVRANQTLDALDDMTIDANTTPRGPSL